jgi:hypothetical protein
MDNPCAATLRRISAVEGARLENESGDAHRGILNHLFAQSIQRLPATQCGNAGICRRFWGEYVGMFLPCASVAAFVVTMNGGLWSLRCWSRRFGHDEEVR